jgi:hypothetical protein
LLVAGCWLLVAGCWLLVAGCWLLVAGSRNARIYALHDAGLTEDLIFTASSFARLCQTIGVWTSGRQLINSRCRFTRKPPNFRHMSSSASQYNCAGQRCLLARTSLRDRDVAERNTGAFSPSRSAPRARSNISSWSRQTLDTLMAVNSKRPLAESPVLSTDFGAQCFVQTSNAV